jgi:hypothetical protein
MNEQLQQLCDMATEAHERIQTNFAEIDPIIGVNQRMRDSGFAADLMTIDCLKTGKRIILILNDDIPNILNYQFSYKATDPEGEFQQLDFDKVTSQLLYDWIANYFSS